MSGGFHVIIDNKDNPHLDWYNLELKQVFVRKNFFEYFFRIECVKAKKSNELLMEERTATDKIDNNDILPL